MVKICQQDTFPSATLTFMVWKIFGNRQKHQRHRSAWVGQADRNLGIGNRNHSENCHHLSLNSKQKLCNKIKQRARSASLRALSLPRTDVDFIIITIYHSSPFFSVAAKCIRKAKIIVLKKQLLRALRRIPLHRRLESSSNSADQVRRRLLLRKDGRTLAGRTTKKQCC